MSSHPKICCMHIKQFQKQYGLTNRDMAKICQCSLPTIQKWRSDEVKPAGPARQLMRFLDYSAEGDPAKLRQVLSSLNQWVGTQPPEDMEDLGRLENSMTEVVDRIELMLESRRKERQLAESEARYRSMVEGSRNPVCRWLPDTTLTYVNDAYREFFHADGADLLGRKWIEFVPEEKRAPLMAIVSDIIRRAEPDMVVHESIGRDGRQVVQEWHDIPVKNERGEVSELHSVGYDITEVVELRTEVEELGNVRRSLMSLCEQPFLIFNDSGDFIEGNARFQEKLAKNRDWQRLADMIPDLSEKPLQRLLKRITSADETVYKARIGEGTWHLHIRLLKKGGTESHYLAVFNRMEAPGDIDTDSRIRLSKEETLPGMLPMDPHDLKEQLVAVALENRLERAFVLCMNGKTGVMAPLVEWSREGFSRDLDENQLYSGEVLPWLEKRAFRGQMIQIDDVTRLPRTARAEQEVFLAAGLRSLLLLPLEAKGNLVGLAGFGHGSPPRLWHQQEMISLQGFLKILKAQLPAGAACVEEDPHLVT